MTARRDHCPEPDPGPHPGGRPVVGHDVQTYNAFLPPSRTAAADYTSNYRPPAPQYQSIPGMRPAYEGEQASTTPIYDALYSEFRRLFRALPGDRSGEEDLSFAGFGYCGSATGYAPWESTPPSHGYAPSSAYGYNVNGRHRGYLSLPPGRG